MAKQTSALVRCEHLPCRIGLGDRPYSNTLRSGELPQTQTSSLEAKLSRSTTRCSREDVWIVQRNKPRVFLTLAAAPSTSPVPLADPNLDEPRCPRGRRSPRHFDHRRLAPASLQRLTSVGSSAVPPSSRSDSPTTTWRLAQLRAVVWKNSFLCDRRLTIAALLALSLCCCCLRSSVATPSRRAQIA